MNSRIREIVIDHVGEYAALIAELEAYHACAMVEAADGALIGKRALDRALGRDVTLDVRPGSKSFGDAVSDYVAGMVDDLRLRRDAATNKTWGFYSAEAHRLLSSTCDRKYPAAMYYSTPSGRRVLVTCITKDPEASFYKWGDKVCVGEVAQYIGAGPRLHDDIHIDDIIERNAPAWQGGESDDERARR